MQPFDWQTNSPFQHLRKCVTNSVENMHTDVRVKRVYEKKKVIVRVEREKRPSKLETKY